MWDKQNGPIVRSEFQQPDPTGKTDVYNRALVQTGVVPAARLAFATDASNTDTVTIGGHEFRFLTTLVAANTYTQVKRGTSAAQTLADLVKAINGTASANVVQATTAFSKTVLADAVGTSLRLRWATARGGLPLAGVSDSIALAEALTPAGDIWSAADLNVSGKAPSSGQASLSVLTVTAQMVTNGSFQVELPFTPTIAHAFVTASTGVQRASTDAITISSNAVNVALGGGASPAIQAGDLVMILAAA